LIGISLFFKEHQVSFNGSFDKQHEIDLFSSFSSESMTTVRSAVFEASTYPDVTSKRIMAKRLAPVVGDIVGIRLNLNLMKSKGVPVQTVHAGNRSDGYKRNKGLYNGSAIAYRKSVTVENAYFNVSQKGREDVASGAVSKYPLASVDGTFVDVTPDFSGIEISFNPKRVRLFCDSENRPIRFATQATIYANRIYVRGRVEYYTVETAPEKVGASPCNIKF
jgi:hypothetical protein